jgi:hypothetical protein
VSVDLNEINDPDTGSVMVVLNKIFKIDGNKLTAAGFFTGPHKTVSILFLCLACITLFLSAGMFLFLRASIIIISSVIISALLTILLFRASYIRTMPFEIQIDRNTKKLRITRPDMPEQYFNIQNVKFDVRSSDYFTDKSKPYWLVAQLPNSKRFFLADAPGMDDAETLRFKLNQWLNDTN